MEKSLKKLINQYNEVQKLKRGILFNDTFFPNSDKSIFSTKTSYKNNKIIKPQIYLKLDSDFSKSQFTSLSKDIKYTWKSISNHIKDYSLIKNNKEIPLLSQDDIIQGNIGNSYFISALKFLSEEPDRIISLFESENYKENNYFVVNTYIHGYKYKIIVDDKFPFNENELAFCNINTKTNNIWPIILEKVWAKINSSYEDIIMILNIIIYSRK